MKAFITVGISASGKSTWAREYAQKHGAIITNRDDIRFSLAGATNWSEYKFNNTIENMVTCIQQETVEWAAAYGREVIVADTNLKPVHRNAWVNKLDRMGYEVEEVLFVVSLAEAIRRDAARPNSVGRDVLYKQWGQWNDFMKERDAKWLTSS